MSSYEPTGAYSKDLRWGMVNQQLGMGFNLKPLQAALGLILLQSVEQLRFS